ncbi:hypothetical protein [Paenibacillus abyssi]|uniref:Uncharacterized protein n=1 Tax=Paenibacillus abyssi TaxID=1340531 RepID=A0A917FVP9_9BACL|nr:hypothetical protein [Paenibacillus abyssi]GGG05074.1 hypothetical protein GCM10010916_22710 [Paenibacillus abyssi]
MEDRRWEPEVEIWNFRGNQVKPTTARRIHVAEGNAYFRVDSAGGWSSTGTESRFGYAIPEASCKRPLTFEIKRYPGYILQSFELKIQ